MTRTAKQFARGPSVSRISPICRLHLPSLMHCWHTATHWMEEASFRRCKIYLKTLAPDHESGMQQSCGTPCHHATQCTDTQGGNVQDMDFLLDQFRRSDFQVPSAQTRTRNGPRLSLEWNALDCNLRQQARASSSQMDRKSFREFQPFFRTIVLWNGCPGRERPGKKSLWHAQQCGCRGQPLLRQGPHGIRQPLLSRLEPIRWKKSY